MRKLLFFVVGLTFISSVCCESNSTSSFVPSNMHDGILVGVPYKQGMDTTVLNEISNQISTSVYPNIHSLLIYKDSSLVFEKYLSGSDERMGRKLGELEHDVDDLHDLRSITKSVVSACVGIAISQGKIKSEDDLVFNYLPEYSKYKDDVKSKLTIAHLLLMTSGFSWNEEIPYTNPLNTERMMDTAGDPVGFVLSRPLDTIIGTKWQYNGGNTEVLAAIIEKTSGKTIEEFAMEYLFKPLGIKEYEWDAFPQTNKPSAARGLRMRSRDLMKLGILYLQNGKWEGKQIVPEQWIEKSFQKTVATTRKKGVYGYHFWVYNDTVQEKGISSLAAVGNGGQRIFIDRKNNLVVVITAGNYNLWTLKNDSYALYKKVYDSFKVE